MAAPATAKATEQYQSYSFRFDYSLPNWSAREQTEAQEILVNTLCPYLNLVFESNFDSGFCSGHKKLTHFSVLRSTHEIGWSKNGPNGGRKHIKIGAPPPTGIDYFTIHILRKSLKQAFEVRVKVVEGHEAALRMHALLIQNPYENQDFSGPSKKQKSLVIDFLPMTYAPVPEPAVPTASEEVVVEVSAETVAVSNETVIEEPNDTSHDDLLLLLATVHEKANEGKGFALPVSAEKFREIRLTYVKQNPNCISVPSSDTRAYGAAIGRFTKSAQDNGFLVRRNTDNAWFLTKKSAQELGIEKFAVLDPSQVKSTNTPCPEVPQKAVKKEVAPPVKVLARAPDGEMLLIQFSKPQPVSKLVLEPILSEEAIDRNISELKAEMLSNEEKISQLQQRNSTVIPKELEKLKDQKQVWVERRNKRQAEELLRRLEEQVALVRASLEKPGEITDADFQQWKEDFER